MALAVLSIAASAQSKPNRLIVNQKSGQTAAYRLQSVDSLSFKTVEGKVTADVTFNKYATGSTGDTIWVAVKKSAACMNYRIDVLPTARVKAYTDDNIAYYFDINSGSKFDQDFTNAQLTGFTTEMVPGSSYTVFTLAYDQYGTPCEVSRALFDTPKTPVKGDPQVDCTYESTPQEITFNFTPNKDVLNYYITIFKKGEAESQFEQWAPMLNFANMSQMIAQFSGQAYKGNQSRTINGLVPDTDYELYILPVDRSGNYADLNVVECSTKAMGGNGKSVMSITIGDFQSAENNEYAQTVTYTPNDQTVLHRDMLLEKAAFNDPTGAWAEGESAVVKYLKTDNDLDPYWDQYGTDEAVWYVKAGTAYIAYSIGQNAKGEWGELAKKEFTTPSAASAPVYAPFAAPAKRVAPAKAGMQNGVAPVKAFTGVKLSE